MEHDASIHPESLLEHGPRLRALARRLVGDGHAADDLVQETWVRAVERGPGGATAPWRWLARVLRNLAFQGRRLDAARAGRERAAARGETSGDEAERFAVHRELVDAIQRLEAPYRQAILLRYFDALPPRAIAARLGLPVKTVKSHLNRGLALLRAELDRRHGSRESWLAAMVPLAHMGSPGPRLLGNVSSALERSAPLKLAAGVVLLSAGAYGVYVALPSRGAVPEPLVEAGVAAAPAPEVSLAAPAGGEARAPEPAGAAAAVARAPALPQPVLALQSGVRHGRVLGPDGNGLAGVWVGFFPGVSGAPEPVESVAGGAFELAPLPYDVRSRDERYATVLYSLGIPESRPADEHVVVVAPAVALGGVVRDEHGAPAAHVPVRFEVPLSFRGRFREVLDGSHEYGWSTETDEQGRFALAGAPALPCARLAAWSGPTSGAVAVPEHDALDLELVLSPSDVPPDVMALHVVGEVRRAGGALAPAALVSLAGVSTRADAAALFELRVPPASAGELRRLVAVRPGEQAAAFEPERDGSGAEFWPPFVTLWLGGPPESIAGHVLGTDGAPLAGAPVWIEDLTFLGGTHNGFLTTEHLMAGKSDAERWFSVTSDAGGGFELGGLAQRSYTLAAMDPATLQIVRSQPVPAGSRDAELAFAEAGLFERVAGRAVDTHGVPLAGLHLELGRRTFDVRSPAGDSWSGGEQRSHLTTDEEGRFEFERVPREGMRLHVADNAFRPVDLELDGCADPLHVEVVVSRLGHAQIAVAGALPEGGSIELRDAADQVLEYYVFGGGSVSIRYDVALGNPNEFAGDRTPVLSVPEAVRAAVLLDAQGAELRRVPLTVGAEVVLVTL